jgi:phenylpropionate dioxygenase-like ring-hydroxylating dioxygenase large terminal subunit
VSTIETERRPVPADNKETMPSVGQYLENDSRPVPPELTQRTRVEPPHRLIDPSAYWSRDYHEREAKALWQRVWQMACREADIPDPGDQTTYDVLNQSVVIVRQNDGSVRAFNNACTHRGTRLLVGTESAPNIQCPYHGWTFDLDGGLAYVPCRWDFPNVTESEFRLPEVRVGVWDGWVFINFDPEAQPFDDFIGSTLPEHFRLWPMADRVKVLHIGKVLRCNWKLAIHAFIEVYHVSQTHPLSIAIAQGESAEYDYYGPHARFIQIGAAPSLQLPAGTFGEQDTVNELVTQFMGSASVEDRLAGRNTQDIPQIVEPGSSRAVLAEFMRGKLQEQFGIDYSSKSDTEVLDPIEYFVFPNFMPWGGFGYPLTYRVRPWNDSPDQCLFEVMIFSPRDPETVSAEATYRLMGEDENFEAALGQIGLYLDEDTANLARQQLGVRTGGLKKIVLANYQESNIQWMHENIDRYLTEDGS